MPAKIQSGSDYANNPKLEVLTIYGAELALFDAAKEWNKLGSNEKTKDKSLELIKAATTHSKYLESAGTTQIIQRFFEHANKQGTDYAKVLDALNPETVAKMENYVADLAAGRFRINQWDIRESRGALNYAMAQAYQQPINKNILGDAFWKYLGSHGAELKDIQVQPYTLTPAQDRVISKYESIVFSEQSRGTRNEVMNNAIDAITNKLVDWGWVDRPAKAPVYHPFDADDYKTTQSQTTSMEVSVPKTPTKSPEALKNREIPR